MKSFLIHYRKVFIFAENACIYTPFFVDKGEIKTIVYIHTLGFMQGLHDRHDT